MAIDRFRPPAPWGSEDIPPGPRPKDRKEYLTENKLLQLAQAGGSPYDEEAYMPNSSDYIGRGNMAYNPRARAMGYGDSPANTFLNDRLYERYMGGGGPSPYGGGGTDYELQMRYGPNGAPQDPMPPQPYNSYPQRRSEEDVKARIIRELMK